MLDLAIIGGGPAGLTAGLYATRGGLKNVTMFEKAVPGGQIVLSSEVENYPGVATRVTGFELMETWPEQSARFGLRTETTDVTCVSKNDNNNTFKIETAEQTVFEALSVIICTGGSPKRAGFLGEDDYWGRGVSTCATCDGFFYKDQEVVVLGGGDTALEEAMYLSKLCKRVYLVHRRNQFRAVPCTVERVRKTSNIELILDSVVEKVAGDSVALESVTVKNLKSGKSQEIKVPGIFIFVGYDTNKDALIQENGDYLCAMNEKGEVIVDINMRTSVDGLFAAGDIRSMSPRQVVCAAGDGAIAALQAAAYIDNIHGSEG